MLRLIVIAVPRSIAMTRPDAMQTGPCAEDAEVSPSRVLFSFSSPRARRPLRFIKLLCHLRQSSVHSSFPQINLDLKIRAAGYFMKPALTLEAAEAGLLFAHALAELFGAVPIADRDVALIP